MLKHPKNQSVRSFRREIVLILAIKLVAILFIKWQFFSTPVDLELPANSVEQRLGVADAAAFTTESLSQPRGQ